MYIRHFGNDFWCSHNSHTVSVIQSSLLEIQFVWNHFPGGAPTEDAWQRNASRTTREWAWSSTGFTSMNVWKESPSGRFGEINFDSGVTERKNSWNSNSLKSSNLSTGEKNTVADDKYDGTESILRIYIYMHTYTIYNCYYYYQRKFGWETSELRTFKNAQSNRSVK